MLEMGKASRDMILAMFGVPPTKLGILENANYKAQNADEFFWTETIDPKLTRMEKSLQRLVDLFHPGENLHIQFERLNFTDDLPAATVAKLLMETNTRTLNEIRSYQGLDPIVGGDVVLLPSNLAPSMLGTDPDPALAADGADDAANMYATMPLLAKAAQRVGQRAPATAFTVAKQRDSVIKRAKADHAPALSRFFEGQQQRVAAKLHSYKGQKKALSAGGIFDKAAEDAALKAALAKVHTAGIKAAYTTANTIGVNVSFNLSNPRLEAFQGKLAQAVTGINDTTMTDLDEQINEGLRRGYSIPQIAGGVEDEDYAGIDGVFSQAKGYRAELIARTESMNAYNGAAVVAYQESGMVDQCELLDGEDDEACAARNGKVVDLAEVDGYLAQEHPNGSLCAVPIVRAA